MTGREVLRMYARLRGLPEQSVEAVAGQLLYHLGLQQYADRCAYWP
jgi:ABC-type multidrug transport system ATPase subunit